MILKKPNKKINIPWIPIIGIFLISPLAYMPSLLDSALFIRYTSLSFFLIISLVILKKELIGFKFSFVFIVYLMFYIWSLLSALWAYNSAEAIFESYKILMGLGVFFIVVFLFGNKTYEKILLKTIIICISVYIAFGVVQLLQINYLTAKIFTILYH